MFRPSSVMGVPPQASEQTSCSFLSPVSPLGRTCQGLQHPLRITNMPKFSQQVQNNNQPPWRGSQFNPDSTTTIPLKVHFNLRRILMAAGNLQVQGRLWRQRKIIGWCKQKEILLLAYREEVLWKLWDIYFEIFRGSKIQIPRARDNAIALKLASSPILLSFRTNLCSISFIDSVV
jgi:hypothetical protein